MAGSDFRVLSLDGCQPLSSFGFPADRVVISVCLPKKYKSGFEAVTSVRTVKVRQVTRQPD